MEKILQSDICKSFISDGKCKEYNLNFAFFEYDNIEVYIDDNPQTSGFEVKIDADNEGGSVIFNMAPALGAVVTIIRRLPIKRITDFKEGGPFRASKVNMEFDYQLACIEQVEEKLDRAVYKPLYIIENIDLAIPYPQAGKSLVWNMEANALKNSDMSMGELEEAVKNSEELYEKSLLRLDELRIYSEKAAESCNQAYESACKVEEIYSTKSNISLDNLSEEGKAKFAEKANVSLNNVAENIDYVVESWVSDDKANWYRIHKSGWIEQGGIINNRSSYIANLNFLLPFSNTNYVFIPNSSQTNHDIATVVVVSESSITLRTETSICLLSKYTNYSVGSGVTTDINWYACGF